MKLILQTLLLLLPLSATQAQRLAITAVVTEPTCNQNGQICLRVTGGTRPYRYDLDSMGGSIHLSQDDSCFTGRGRGTYQARVTDFLGRKDSIFVTIVNHYVPMVLNAVQIGSCVQLTVTGGRKPYRYYYRNWQMGQTLAVDSIAVDSTTRMLCCLSNGNYSFEVEDSCQNVYPAALLLTQISLPTIQIDTVSHGDSLDISLMRTAGGEPPYTYICTGDFRGHQTNSTGIFTGLKGCTFSITVTDRCGRSRYSSVSFSTPPILTLLCTNAEVGTASMSVTGGKPPYRFLEINSGVENATGQFNNLPLQQAYIFMVSDSCRHVAWDSRTVFDAWANWERCPFTGTIDLYSSMSTAGVSNIGSWFPITYTCTNCIPIQTIVDSGNTSSPQLSRVRFQNRAAGDYRFKIVNHCGETRWVDVQTDTGSVRVSAVRNCQSNQIRVVNTEGDFFILKDKWGNSLDSNAIGVFTAGSVDTFGMEARRTGCRNSRIEVLPPNTLGLIYEFNCYTRLLKLFTDGIQPTFILKDKFGHRLDSNQTGIFQLSVLDTFIAMVENPHCLGRSTTIYPMNGFDVANVCLNISRQNNAFTWNLVCTAANSSGSHHFRLTGGPDSTRQYNIFNNASQANFYFLQSGTYTLEYDCKQTTFFVPVPDTTYEIITNVEQPCPQDSIGYVFSRVVRAPNWSNWQAQHEIFFCNYQYPELWYVLRDASGSSSSNSSYGRFAAKVNRTYYLSTYVTAWNRSFYKLIKIDTVHIKYQRPELTAVFDPVCIGDSSSRATIQVNGGVLPYTFEWTQPVHVRPARTVDSNIIFFDNLPYGTYTIRVVDRCRISADITGSIAPLTVTARYRRECHNHLILITNELRNAKYRWTNRRGDSIGNTPILTLRNAPVDSQTYQVTIFWKNCQWTSRVYVPRNDLQIIQNQIDTMICEEDFITLNGHIFPKAGVFRDTFLNQTGCDSVVILNLRKQNCGYELPNAFAPEMGLLYTLYPNPKVAQIEQLSIFDRWGNKIYESEGTFVSGQTGWDGTFQGQRVDAGVFVAVARIVYKNGTRAVLKTDLNVIY